MHDPRIGRFFAVDPLTAKYPWYTPYQFSGNKVIDHVELEGLEEAKPGDRSEVGLNLNGSISIFNGENKPSYRLGATVSYSTPNLDLNNTLQLGFNLDASFSIYNGGSGTSGTSRNAQTDFTLSAYSTLGKGEGTPLPMYTINSMTPSALKSTFSSGITWGGMYNINSAESTEGFNMLFGFRGKNYSFWSNNDEKGAPYFGFSRYNALDSKGHKQGTDRAWTGAASLSVSTPIGLIEGGYQSFTGDAARGVLFPDTKFRLQTDYQVSLNKANSFLRYTPNNSFGTSVQLDIYGSGWFQNAIHALPGMSNEYFKYDYRTTGFTITNSQSLTNE